MHRLYSHPSPQRKPQHPDAALCDAAAMYYSLFLNMDSPFHSIYTVSWHSGTFGANIKQSTWRDAMFASSKIKPQLTAQVEHFALIESHVCYFSSSSRAFFFFFHLFLFREQILGERSLSGGSPPLSPAHQHASFNHSHISIHLPQAMNYSTLRLPHENGERRHEKSLFPVFTLLLTPPPPLFPLPSGSLPHAPLSLSGTGRSKMAGNQLPPISVHFLPWRCLIVNTRAGFMLFIPKLRHYQQSNQTMFPVTVSNSAHSAQVIWQCEELQIQL